jgi:ABC-2 type transport system ATP-binding protein
VSAATREVVLSLRGLTKSFGDVVAVDDLTLDVYRGEIFGFLGPNGAGKTTTINIVCGLLKCDTGEVRFHDNLQQENSRGWKSNLGLCPETAIIWESLTCLEQLEFIGQQYDLSQTEARERGSALLEILDLQEKRDKYASTLSGGMKRRLNLALALVHDPPILILDEPQAGLDPQGRILVREFIRTMAQEKTIILTSHDMDEVDRLVDRVGIIDHGRLLVLDTPENLKSRIGTGDILEIKLSAGQEAQIADLAPKLPAAAENISTHDDALRITNVTTLDVLPALLEVLDSAGIEIRDLVVRNRTLEDVFIQLTGRRLQE